MQWFLKSCVSSDTFWILGLLVRYTHTEPHCSTHRCSYTPWENWISLLSITSLRTAVPGCLICHVSAPPSPWRGRSVQPCNKTAAHTETHTASLLASINTIGVDEEYENRADLIGVVYILPERDEELKRTLMSSEPRDVNIKQATMCLCTTGWMWGLLTGKKVNGNNIGGLSER